MTMPGAPILRPAVLTAVLVILAALAPRATAAQRTPANPLAGVEAWECSFRSFAVARWRDGEPALEAGTDDLTFRVENIDLDRRAARIVAAAVVEVTAVLTPTGLNLIEQTPGGNFILTTIFVSTVAADTYHAVHARHIGDLVTPPSASQFHGTCGVAD